MLELSTSSRAINGVLLARRLRFAEAHNRCVGGRLRTSRLASSPSATTRTPGRQIPAFCIATFGDEQPCSIRPSSVTAECRAPGMHARRRAVLPHAARRTARRIPVGCRHGFATARSAVLLIIAALESRTFAYGVLQALQGVLLDVVLRFLDAICTGPVAPTNCRKRGTRAARPRAAGLVSRLKHAPRRPTCPGGDGMTNSVGDRTLAGGVLWEER